MKKDITYNVVKISFYSPNYDERKILLNVRLLGPSNHSKQSHVENYLVKLKNEKGWKSI